MKFLVVRLHLYRFPDGSRIVEKRGGHLAVVNTPAGEASWYVNAIET